MKQRLCGFIALERRHFAINAGAGASAIARIGTRPDALYRQRVLNVE